MILSNHTDGNSANTSGIDLQITEPSLIAVPVPKIQFANAITPLHLFISIANSASLPVPFVYGLIVPELVGTEGQPIHPQKLIEHDFQSGTYPGIFLPPNRSGELVHLLRANLCQQANSFQLRVDISDYLRPTNPSSAWLFNELTPGVYQLRLMYSNPKSTFSLVDLVQNVSEVVDFEVPTVETAPISLYLIEPLGDAHESVMVENISFETLIPQTGLRVSNDLTTTNVPLQIGLAVTNTTATPWRFCTHASSLLLDLIGEQGLLVQQSVGGGGSLGLRWFGPKDTDFHLVMPGDSLPLFVTVSLELQADGTWTLRGTGGYGDNYFQSHQWLIKNLSPGNYWLRVTYRSPRWEPNQSFSPNLDLMLENLWEGKVYTPFRAIQLT